MKLLRDLVLSTVIVGCSASPERFAPSDFVRVSCASRDGGKTCFGYGEVYGDGRSDACGRIPGGSEFAFRMTYEISGNTLCETVTKSSDLNTMPVGKTICAIHTQRRPSGFDYRFSDDPTDEVRHS